MTHTLQERQRQEARRNEQIRNDHLQRLHQENVLRANQTSDRRVQTKRRVAAMAQEEQELALAARLEQEAADRAARQRREEQDARLAKEMERIKLESEREQRMRQHIRETSSELRGAYQEEERGCLQPRRTCALKAYQPVPLIAHPHPTPPSPGQQNCKTSCRLATCRRSLQRRLQSVT